MGLLLLGTGIHHSKYYGVWGDGLSCTLSVVHFLVLLGVVHLGKIVL
jgi:hypothetical protein